MHLYACSKYSRRTLEENEAVNDIPRSSGGVLYVMVISVESEWHNGRLYKQFPEGNIQSLSSISDGPFTEAERRNGMDFNRRGTVVGLWGKKSKTD